MSTAPSLRPAVLAARDRLAVEREKLQRQHDAGSFGVQVCAHLSDVLDRVIINLCDDAAEAARLPDWRERVALIAHGGYGRQDVAPFSDVDLLVLRGKSEVDVAEFSRQVYQNIFDAGLKLGYGMRTVSDAVQSGMNDINTLTSLAESRALEGDEDLFHKFFERFRRRVLRGSRRFVPAIEASRRDERRQFGQTVYLLEPNVKRSRGTLRDIQLVRWVGFAVCGQSDLEVLMRRGLLSDDDYQMLRKAREFLLQLRNELHFRANRAQDLLARDEQLRIADHYGYIGSPGVLPVERFMRDYFEHTGNVRYAAAHFVASFRARSTVSRLAEPVVSRRAGRDYLVGPIHIKATRHGLPKVTGDLAEVLQLMDLANHHNKRIEHATWQAIRSAMIANDDVELSDEAAQRFLSLMSRPGRLADLLRRLHEMRVLEKIVPAMGHARCLMQFNEYHKYTVDEHSLLAVQSATDFLDDPGPIGEAYRGLRKKHLLHLALLLHDLGKGFEEDHSDVGARLAEQTAQRLGLSSSETEMLKFLVQKHLMMAHLAFRHDLNDEAIAVQLAVAVGSPYVLQMLYVLSCADLAAVGPGVLNDWKRRLLTELYFRARSHLVDEPQPLSDAPSEQRREQVRQHLGKDAEDPWFVSQLTELPASFLLADESTVIADQLRQMHQLPVDQVLAFGRYDPDRKATAYTVATHEEVTPGVFHKLTGAISSNRMEILSAEIHTLAENLVIDTFYVEDLDHADEPPPGRIQQVGDLLAQSLISDTYRAPSFQRVWKKTEQRMSEQPTRVRFDNTTSERFTIMAVFAYDRTGLLYDISRTLFEHGLSVHVAKIGTYIDQVVDVFYFHDEQGSKIQNDQRLEVLRRDILAAINPE